MRRIVVVGGPVGAVAVMALGALALAACTSADAPRAEGAKTTTTIADEGGHWVEQFVDTGRRTIPKTGAPIDHRDLPTTIYRPAGVGPFPLVVFSHGNSGHPDKFTKLFSAWADAGIAVAAPAFPLTNSGVDPAAADLGDAQNQPGDVSFVLDRVLELNGRPDSRLFGAIDESAVGAGGLSLGGISTYRLVYGPDRDVRIAAVAILDSVRPSDAVLDGHVPLLIAHGDADPTLPYTAAREAFDAAAPPAWLLTLHGAEHSTQWEDDPTPYDEIAERVTTDFWLGTIGGSGAALAGLVQDGSMPGTSSVEVKRARPAAS